jgi:hypothetical protein
MKRTTSIMALMMVAAACGGDNGTANDQSVPNDLAAASHDLAMSAHDLAVPPDLSTNMDFGGITCGTTTCSGSDVCCAMQVGMTATYMCAPSCPDGGVIFTCDGPEDCAGGGGSNCCGDVMLTGGPTFTMCNIMAVTSCKSSCTIATPLACPETWHVQMCHHSSECNADPNYDTCCMFSYNGNTVQMCADALLRTGAQSCDM